MRVACLSRHDSLVVVVPFAICELALCKASGQADATWFVFKLLRHNLCRVLVCVHVRAPLALFGNNSISIFGIRGLSLCPPRGGNTTYLAQAGKGWPRRSMVLRCGQWSSQVALALSSMSLSLDRSTRGPTNQVERCSRAFP